jgi:hypothetical protein
MIHTWQFCHLTYLCTLKQHNMTPMKRIALVAHDNCKKDMVDGGVELGVADQP